MSDVAYNGSQRSKRNPAAPMPSSSYSRPSRTRPLFLRSLDLGQGLSNLETRLLPQPQDLESLEVGQSTSAHLASHLLRPGALAELLRDVLGIPLLLDGTGARATGQFGEDDGGELDVVERNGLAGDDSIGGGSINENLGGY